MATNTHLPGIGKISRLMLSGHAFNLDEDDIRFGDPVRACEVCGTELPSSDMIAFHMVISSPGHHTLPPFQHPDIEHWACSIDHWDTLATRVQGEMREYLQSAHVGVEGSIHDKKE